MTHNYLSKLCKDYSNIDTFISLKMISPKWCVKIRIIEFALTWFSFAIFLTAGAAGTTFLWVVEVDCQVWVCASGGGDGGDRDGDGSETGGNGGGGSVSLAEASFRIGSGSAITSSAVFSIRKKQKKTTSLPYYSE